MNFHRICIWFVKRIKSSSFLSRLRSVGRVAQFSFLFFSVEIIYTCREFVMNMIYTHFLSVTELFMPQVCSKYLSLCMHHFYTLGLYVLFRAYLTMIPSWIADVLSSSFAFSSFSIRFISSIFHIFQKISACGFSSMYANATRCLNSGATFEIEKPGC